LYRCEACNTVVPPRTQANKVVLETRPKVYRNVKKPKGKRRRNQPVDIEATSTSGTEIVHEALLCGACASKATTAQLASVGQVQAAPVVEEAQAAV
jgi:hypothetical protein